MSILAEGVQGAAKEGTSEHVLSLRTSQLVLWIQDQHVTISNKAK